MDANRGEWEGIGPPVIAKVAGGNGEIENRESGRVCRKREGRRGLRLGLSKWCWLGMMRS